MLNQVLREIETTRGPVTISELSYRLGVERSALESMIQFWVRKGRIQDDDAPSPGNTEIGGCGTSCTGIADCVFITKMPKTYSLAQKIEVPK